METQTIGLFEAKTHLSELVARAERGDEIIITRHNRPVARIVPVAAMPLFDAERRRKAVAEMQRVGRQVAKRTGQPITADEIVGWVRESRDSRGNRIGSASSEALGRK